LNYISFIGYAWIKLALLHTYVRNRVWRLQDFQQSSDKYWHISPIGYSYSSTM